MIDREIAKPLEESINKIGLLIKKAQDKKTQLEILERGWQGDIESCSFDFTGTSYFFREIYPDLKELFYQIRGQGLIKGYIQD